VDIAEERQTFLGFSWEWRGQKAFFVFTVLPFGANASPFYFHHDVSPPNRALVLASFLRL
jgi:hypothetical protein